MASYSVVIKQSARKELTTIPHADRGRVAARIDGLAHEPRPPGAIRLAGRVEYRLRQGDYRILYEVHDDVRMVRVMRFAHRTDAYR